ncbi:hypothetical protein K2Y11_08805 [bacterium]|nr:hypothetical protein [bacterium]
MSVADFMRSSISDRDIKYPLIHENNSRIQIVYGESLYGMLIRNRNFWCGYTLLTQEQAEAIDSWRPILGASFLGPASIPITWQMPDRYGQLANATSLLNQNGGDFWIGFHKELGDAPVDRVKAMHILGTFVASVQKVIDANANPPV